jgi:hypothetical protein
MPDNTRHKTRLIATNRRVKNEVDSKVVNEKKVEKVVEGTEDTDQSLLHTMSFTCECDKKYCAEIIQMSTDEYELVHRKANNFVVVPSHVKLDIEKIVVTFSSYCIVEKFSLPS